MILIFRIFYFDRNIVEVTMKLISILNRSLKKRKIRDKDILNSVVYYHIQEKAFSVHVHCNAYKFGSVVFTDGSYFISARGHDLSRAALYTLVDVSTCDKVICRSSAGKTHSS